MTESNSRGSGGENGGLDGDNSNQTVAEELPVTGRSENGSEDIDELPLEYNSQYDAGLTWYLSSCKCALCGCEPAVTDIEVVEYRPDKYMEWDYIWINHLTCPECERQISLLHRDQKATDSKSLNKTHLLPDYLKTLYTEDGISMDRYERSLEVAMEILDEGGGDRLDNVLNEFYFDNKDE